VRVLITGVCGFVGSALARYLRTQRAADVLTIVGLDNLSRPGSELNRAVLTELGVEVLHGDIRSAADLDACGAADWVIDAAANPSVLAGVDGRTSSRQLVDHNLLGTVNVLEYCKARSAGLVLLSTSRVYSIAPLAALPVEVHDAAFRPALDAALPVGLGEGGVREEFATAAPISLYGATKLASEALALEYHHTFGFPVWVNRCGVLAGAGQFGHAAQGIYSYWINAHLRRRPLRYIGFGGSGHQVRDCLHPADLGALVLRQMEHDVAADERPRLLNVSGGAGNSMSLAQLTAWCDARFGPHAVEADPRPRPFDIPWMVLDSTAACRTWGWAPRIGIDAVLEEIAEHAERHPHWLELSGGAR
jgi:CDP-paratose 2-epimerase